MIRALEILYDFLEENIENVISYNGERDTLELLRDVKIILDESEEGKDLANRVSKRIDDYVEANELCPDCFSDELIYKQDVKPTYYTPGEAHLECTMCGWRSE